MMRTATIEPLDLDLMKAEGSELRSELDTLDLESIYDDLCMSIIIGNDVSTTGEILADGHPKIAVFLGGVIPCPLYLKLAQGAVLLSWDTDLDDLRGRIELALDRIDQMTELPNPFTGTTDLGFGPVFGATTTLSIDKELPRAAQWQYRHLWKEATHGD